MAPAPPPDLRHTGSVPTQPDPYRTLGLTPGATPDEIRRAYRRLAKANHPDAAGEKNLPRFLAIQAAYESLVASRGTRRTGARPATSRPTAREAWRADTSRARAAREGAAAGPAAGPDATATGRRRRPPGEEPRRPPGDESRRPPGDESRRPPGDESRRPAGGRKRASNTATPGSTTYDAVEDEPFEPEWSGGTWYGSSSGTYWTLNPKEYADPRKHGPEYQRRARRPLGDPDQAASVDGGSPGSAPDRPGMAEAWEGWSDDGPDATAGATGAPASHGADAGVAEAGGLFGSIGLPGGFPGRVGLALVGWPPIGIAISTIAGEVTGCGRFAAGCVELFGVGTWLAQLAVIAVLLALPAVAALSAAGTLAALAASIPTAVVLSASGGSREPAASASILGAVLAVAYVAGFVFAFVRRSRHGRVP